MKITILPETSLGKWSIVLSIAFIILIYLKMQYGIPVMSFAIAGLGLAGVIMCIVAMIRNKEISLLYFIPIFVGLLIIFWVSAEIVYPH